MRLQKYSWQIIVVIASLVLVIIWFRDKNLLGAAESALPFYDLQIEYEMTRWAWSSPGVGNSSGIITASFPTYWLLTQIQKVGVPGYVIEAGLFWLVLTIAGISIGFLTKEFFPNLPQKYIILTVIFYWFNPFVLVNVWSRFLYNFMFFWSLLPLVWLIFIKGLRLKDFRFTVLLAISTTVLSYGLTSPAFVMVLWLLLIYTTFFNTFFSKGSWIFSFKYLLLSIFFFSIFNLWWLTQMLGFVGTSSYEAAVSTFFGSIGNLSTLSSISQRLGNLVDLTRLLHADFVQSGPYWAKIYDLFVTRTFEFVVVGVILWTIWKFKKVKEVIFLGTLFIFTMFLTKGIQDPFGEIFQSVFLMSTFLQAFRNPFEKFGFLLTIPESLLFTYGIWVVSYNKNFAKIIYISSLVFLIFFWGFPFWSGLIFTNVKYSGSKELESLEVKVPLYYKNANNFLKETAKDSRFIALPIGDEGITHNWEKPYRGVELTSSLFTTPGISLRTTVPFYNDLAAEISEHQLSRNIIDFAPYTNASHILLRNDIDHKERQMAPPTSVDEVLKGLVEDGLLQIKFSEGKISIYEVRNSYSWTKIYSTKNLLLTNDAKIPEIAAFSDNFPEEKNAFLYSSGKNDDISFQKSIFFPKNMYFQKVNTPTPKDLTEEDLLSRLFYVKHLPGSFYYPLVRLKEKLLEGSQEDYFGWIIYKTGILDKRAVEVYKLKKGGGKEKVILKAEESYKKEFQNMEPEFTQFIGQHSSIEDLVRMSLLYQWILLDRVDSVASDFISEFLANWGIKPKFELPIAENEYIIFGFEIPVSGLYDIKDKAENEGDMYLDGILLSKRPLHLEKGEHEVAFFVKDNFIPTDVLEGEEFMISNSSQNGWNAEIPTIPTTFIVSFDYRFVEGDSFEVNFFQDIDRENFPVLSGGIRKEKMYHGWKRMEKKFTTTPGATKGVLKILPTEKVICKKNLIIMGKCSEKKSSFEIQIRNLKISYVVVPEVALITENGSFDKTETLLGWEKINPASYKVLVQKKDNESEMIVFSELYNSGWKAVFDNEDRIPENRHFLVNGYANGWLIDKEGTYEIDIKYAPEDYFEKAKRMSVLSAVLAISFLVGSIIKKNSK